MNAGDNLLKVRLLSFDLVYDLLLLGCMRLLIILFIYSLLL